MTAPSRVWKLALAPLLIWTGHFFVAYGLMLIFPTSPVIPWIVVLLGALGLAGLFLIHRAASADQRRKVHPAVLVVGIAVAWQSAVAFF